MLKDRLMRMLSYGVAVDLGTVNTLIAISGEGIVLKEPSTVAVSGENNLDIVAIGTDAKEMLGRTPGGVSAIYPFRNGVISDYGLAEAMLKYFIYKALGRRPSMLGVRTMLCVPACITAVEKRALEDAAHGAGARDVYILNEGIAAAIGAGLSVTENMGSMIVDIGGGTTNAAIIAFGGVAASASAKVGGTHIDEAIADYVSKKYGVLIGSRTAEQIKLKLANANGADLSSLEIRGRNIETGLPACITLDSGEISFAIKKPVREILSAVMEALAAAPPELAGDILETGITLTGGGALLPGMAELIARKTTMPVRIADDPMDCVVLGALEALENMEIYKASCMAG